MKSSVALFLALCLSGCALIPEQVDETKNWSVSKLYAEAKKAMNDGQYADAIKHYERIEARFPYGRFAQQAQLEIAYAYYKDKEPASALAAVERFIKLYPNHPTVDYAYYLRGLINFNDDLGFLGSYTGQDMTEGMLSWSPDDVKNHIEFQHRFDKELHDAGEMVFNEGLTFPDQARLVRSDGKGAPAVTDGPFPESKEFLAGYWIVDVDSPERAYELAATASAAPGPGGKPINMAIEVREVMSAPPEVQA